MASKASWPAARGLTAFNIPESSISISDDARRTNEKTKFTSGISVTEQCARGTGGLLSFRGLHKGPMLDQSERTLESSELRKVYLS